MDDMTTPQRLTLPEIVAEVTLDNSGDGIASIGPTRAGERWYPSCARVTVSSNASEPICTVFIGPIAEPSAIIDITGTGSDDSTDSCQGSQLNLGDKVWAQWTDGDPGARATVTVKGEYQIGRP
jgi:hypothetical protein